MPGYWKLRLILTGGQGLHGVGAVVVEGLRAVWTSSRARINNSVDRVAAPLPGATVVQRAVAAAHGEDGQAYSQYNLLTNNCEHFASWARNGNGRSWQVGGSPSPICKYIQCK